MESKISPQAGTLPVPSELVDIPALLRAYESDQPDPMVRAQQVVFGTSGHRGSSNNRSFNKNHILAICQAVCIYRKTRQITGPLFLGFDTHALSMPAFQTTLEVLAANEVTVMLAQNMEYTPTPVISHAILCYNKGRVAGLADGILLTPSHNPPSEGGFKYNPPHGGPAEKEITGLIEREANRILQENLNGIKRIPFEQAIRAPTTHSYDFLTPYIEDLKNVIDMDCISQGRTKIAVDPLGGAGVHYWQPIAEHYKINLSVLNSQVDATFCFMSRDWDGKIRMDPSSKYAMRSTLEKSSKYDVTFACDADHDRHGILTPKNGLMPANDFLATAIFYLFKHRPLWPESLKIGKTIVSSQMIDRVAELVRRPVFEVPVGFKWFVDGLLNSTFGFAGEESAGASFLRMNGNVWTTDKDGMIAGLLAAEMTARLGKDPAAQYQELTQLLGRPVYDRIETAATASQKERLKRLCADDLSSHTLAGEDIESVTNTAPGNNAAIDGIKIQTRNGWLAARPSGTEDVYKIYAESFLGQDHLNKILEEGPKIVTRALELF